FQMPLRIDDSEEACVAKNSIPFKAAYLSKVYFILSFQQLTIAAVSFALFMTPGVRPFVQHYSSTTWLILLFFIISVLCLRQATFYSSQLLGAALLLFSIAAALVFGVLTAKFDTEVVYTVTTMNGGVFLGHAIYCLQTLRSLRFQPSLIATVCLATIQAWILESLLEVASFDYFLCILLCGFFCSYVHWNIFCYMKFLTRNEVLLACSHVYILFPKMHYVALTH
ncbi:hypothetical protein V3C99_016529, partial [Haemonchus contortus]